MRQYNFLQAIYLSFYSKKFYKDVATSWGGYVFIYLFIIIAISMVGWTYKLQRSINQEYLQFSDLAVSQIPRITIHHGKLQTPDNHPYIVKDYQGRTIVVIDQSGKFKTLKEAKSKILITEDKIISSHSPNEIKIYKISPNINVVLDPLVIKNHLKNIVSYLWLALFPLFVVMMFAYRLLQAFIYAIFGKLFSVIVGVNLTYFQILQIALISITPAILFNLIADAINVAILHSTIIYLILGLGYLFYGVLANKH